MKRYLFYTLLFTALCSQVIASNLRITNVAITNQNNSLGYKEIKMDVAWDNSWRTSTTYDAVWLFAKYKLLGTQEWKHATLRYDKYVAPAGVAIKVADAKGAFINRDANGTGNLNFTNLSLAWNYGGTGGDGLNNADSVELCVFGIEMVCIPQGAFYVGDVPTSPGSSNSVNRFKRGGNTTTNRFQINSDTLAITIGNSLGGQLYTSSGNGLPSVTTIPSGYPKGFAPFYCMKYEITQMQYRDFLNKLTRAQQDERINITQIGKYILNNSNPTQRHSIKLIQDAGEPYPKVYGCDLNNNGTPDEADDGEHIACNYLSPNDIFAFADWAALRPMTEFEYEKVCRGLNVAPVPNEMAWGTPIDATSANGITNPGRSNEAPSNNPDANIVADNTTGGPLRVGCMGQTSSSTRINSGGSYYGAMDMSGNCAEAVVSIVGTNVTTFTGVHGDGQLIEPPAGQHYNHNVAGWTTLAMRGGSWLDALTSNKHNVSDRSAVDNLDANSRLGYLGGRLVRKAP